MNVYPKGLVLFGTNIIELNVPRNNYIVFFILYQIQTKSIVLIHTHTHIYVCNRRCPA